MVLPLKLPTGEVIEIDRYSFTLSRWGQKCLSKGVTQLRADTFWAVHSRNLFGYYSSNLISCEEVIMRADMTYDAAKQICDSAGWNISDIASWPALTLWIKAASKYKGCSEYLQLEQTGNISDADLGLVLYNQVLSMKTELQMIQTQVAGYYGCARSVCTYEEMLRMQWSQSTFTNDLMFNLKNTGVKPSLSLQQWLPNNYVLPVEWPNYSTLPLSAQQAAQLISYDMFLNPGPVKLFFNSYFAGNLSATAEKFSLPSAPHVTAFFNYFQQIVPGSGMFYTSPYHSWVDGFFHPFLTFLYTTSIFEGGNPIAYPFFTVAGNVSDSGSVPKNVMNSGKSNVKHTRNYYQYYGSTYIRRYGAQLCSFCPNALTYGYSTLWPVEHVLNCSDGGKYESGLSKDQATFAFVDLLKKTV